MRLFIGVPVPEEGHAGLREVSRALDDGVEDLKLVPDGTWHVTLRFLGNVAEEEVPHIRDAVRDVVDVLEVVPMRIEGVGAFPSLRKARVVWAGVHAPDIQETHRGVNDVTSDFGKPPDTRPFQPHVTLGRLKGRPGDVEAAAEAWTGHRFAAGLFEHVVLYKSTLTPEGPIYEPVERFRLPGGLGGD